MAILDTSFLIDVSYSIKAALEKIDYIKSRGETIYISTPALYEFLSGIENSENIQNKQDKAIELLNGQIILPFDEESAQIGAKIWSELSKKGELIDDVDIMIASVAIKYNEILITRNVKHFQRISKLKIETYI